MNSKRVPAPRVHVEPWPAGGWVVRLGTTPISRHDTEEEAVDRAGAYRRGLEREVFEGVETASGAP